MIAAAASPDLVRLQHEQRLVRAHRLRTLLAVHRLARAVEAQRRAARRVEAARATSTLICAPAQRVAVR